MVWYGNNEGNNKGNKRTYTCSCASTLTHAQTHTYTLIVVSRCQTLVLGRCTRSITGKRLAEGFATREFLGDFTHRSYFNPLLLHSDCFNSIRWQDLMGYTYNCVTSPTFPLELLHFLHKNIPTTAATLAADTPTSNCVWLSIGQLYSYRTHLHKLRSYSLCW